MQGLCIGQMCYRQICPSNCITSVYRLDTNTKVDVKFAASIFNQPLIFSEHYFLLVVSNRGACKCFLYLFPHCMKPSWLRKSLHSWKGDVASPPPYSSPPPVITPSGPGSSGKAEAVSSCWWCAVCSASSSAFTERAQTVEVWSCCHGYVIGYYYKHHK